VLLIDELMMIPTTAFFPDDNGFEPGAFLPFMVLTVCLAFLSLFFYDS
jgi:hypothetical protein